MSKIGKGRKHSESHKNNMSKEWTFIWEGKEITIRNLSKFCRDNNYSCYKASFRIKNNRPLS